MIFNKQNNMTPAKARLKLAVHAGETENFAGGYRYALKYGFCNLEDMIQKFDEIFICLKLLNETGRLAQIDRELLTQLSELLWGSVSYINSQKIHSRVVGIFAEVLSETLFCLLENSEHPFDAFDNYKTNYDDIWSAAAKNQFSK